MKAGIKDIISLGPHNKPSEINNTHVNMQVGLATESHLKHQPTATLSALCTSALSFTMFPHNVTSFPPACGSLLLPQEHGSSQHCRDELANLAKKLMR